MSKQKHNIRFLQEAQYCPKCKTLMQSMLLIHRYNKKSSAALSRPYCPLCRTLELSGDDIDFFIGIPQAISKYKHDPRELDTGE